MLVFEDVLLPAVFLDPSIVLGPGSAWCEDMRMRKSLTLVCRNWGRIAKQYLYRDIILRRVSQAVLLSRTVHLFKAGVAPLQGRSCTSYPLHFFLLLRADPSSGIRESYDLPHLGEL